MAIPRLDGFTWSRGRFSITPRARASRGAASPPLFWSNEYIKSASMRLSPASIVQRSAEEATMKKMLAGCALALSMSLAAGSLAAQSAGDEAKKAGTAAKEAAKDTGE